MLLANAARETPGVMMVIGVLLWLCALMMGCNTGSGSSSRAEMVCPSPKPKGPVPCTTDYNLVCGTFADGGSATFSNGCGACADPRVVRYSAGPCP
jgi:hypothetical protein